MHLPALSAWSVCLLISISGEICKGCIDKYLKQEKSLSEVNLGSVDRWGAGDDSTQQLAIFVREQEI